MTAKDSLSDIAKLGKAVELVAQDNELEVKDFGVFPRLDYDGEGIAGQVKIVCLYDPTKATKPKMEIVQMEGQVEDALDSSVAGDSAEKLASARKKLLESLKNDKRGGFLGDQG